MIRKTFASLAAALLLPVTTHADAFTPPAAPETYALLPEILMAGCTKDGYMHFYGGPVAASLTDLQSLGKGRDDFNLDEYSKRLKKTFADSVARYDRKAVFSANGAIGIDRDLRAFAKRYEEETGITSSFVATYINISRNPDPTCQKPRMR